MDENEAIFLESSDDSESPSNENFSANPRHNFLNEIRLMMHAFGDVQSPLLDSVEKMHKFVFDQMVLFLHLAAKVAEERRSRVIGIEEFMFSLRKKTSRLFHFVRHLQFRDSRSHLPGVVATEERLLLGGQVNVKKEHKRTKIALQFLSCIDSFGELATAYHQGEFDDIRIRKLKFAELFTRNMDIERYTLYCEGRQASFSRKLKKLSHWLDPIVKTLPVNLDKYGWECLAYLAHETVGELMFLTLLVRAERCVAAEEIQTGNIVENFLLEHSNIPTTSKHMDEALRRFFIHYEPQKYFFTSKNQILSSVCSQPILLL